MTRTEAYFTAASQSFAGQTRQLTIPQADLGDIFVQELGYQPLGIASKSLGDGRDLVAIADYYAPAVHLATVEQTKACLRFIFTSIRGVLYRDAATGQDRSVRMFPDVPEPAMANRLYTVNFGPDETLWISRGEREFFIIAPPEEGQRKWRLSTNVILLGAKGNENYAMEAALLRGRELITIETSPDLKVWRERIYTGSYFEPDAEYEAQPWTYGIGDDRQSSQLWTVRDYRAAAAGVSPGLYRGDRLASLAIEGGNGVCFLSNGTALVTCYGAEYPLIPGGKPGQLIVVPPEMVAR